MSYTDRHIIETYTVLFEGLSPSSKKGLIENLSKSLKAETATIDKRFYNSFGGFASEMSAEDIVADIKSSRAFKSHSIKL